MRQTRSGFEQIRATSLRVVSASVRPFRRIVPGLCGHEFGGRSKFEARSNSESLRPNKRRPWCGTRIAALVPPCTPRASMPPVGRRAVCQRQGPRRRRQTYARQRAVARDQSRASPPKRTPLPPCSAAGGGRLDPCVENLGRGRPTWVTWGEFDSTWGGSINFGVLRSFRQSLASKVRPTSTCSSSALKAVRLCKQNVCEAVQPHASREQNHRCAYSGLFPIPCSSHAAPVHLL